MNNFFLAVTLFLYHNMVKLFDHLCTAIGYGEIMKPKIDSTKFGSITIKGEKYTHDVLIRMNGEVKKRKKKLSKAVFGTSHIVSFDEAKHLYEKGARKIIIGSGQSGLVKLSEEAEEFFSRKKCKVSILPTEEAIKSWNDSEKKTVGMFHITC